MKSKYLLLLSASIFVANTGAYADKLDSDGILRSDDGRIRNMSQSGAMKACPRGTHLPTIRELAGLSQARGAKGILEMGQVNPNAVPDGYSKVSAINPNGQKDEFYFNHEGYKPPSGDLENYSFWSSSIDSDESILGLGLDGYYGYIYYGVRTYHNGGYAVRCVVGQ